MIVMKHVVILLSVLIWGGVSFAEKTVPSFYLPVEQSEGRGVHYFADHALDAADTNAQHAVVIIHGLNGGMQDGAGKVRKIIAKYRDTSRVYFVAPCIVAEKLLNEEERAKTVYWRLWQKGQDSPVVPGFSAFDALDRVFDRLNDRSRYPALKTVLFCGYSAGGQLISRYMAVTAIRPREGLQVNFAAGAPSTWLFLNRDAPWHFGLDSRNRYTAGVTDEMIFNNLASRYGLCFCGTADIATNYLDDSSSAMAQGTNRYERFKRFRAHIGTFPQLRDAFRFTEVKGGTHGGHCYDNEAFVNLVFGSRQPIP